MNQVKCTHCDGLGHFYNHETFQTEHCPHCEGKGYIEVHTAPVIDETKIDTSRPVVEELKKTPKKAKVEETVAVEEPIVIEEPTVEEPTLDPDAK
jgi:RecJ-like exonuclease